MFSRPDEEAIGVSAGYPILVDARRAGAVAMLGPVRSAEVPVDTAMAAGGGVTLEPAVLPVLMDLLGAASAVAVSVMGRQGLDLERAGAMAPRVKAGPAVFSLALDAIPAIGPAGTSDAPRHAIAGLGIGREQFRIQRQADARGRGPAPQAMIGRHRCGGDQGAGGDEDDGEARK